MLHNCCCCCCYYQSCSCSLLSPCLPPTCLVSGFFLTLTPTSNFLMFRWWRRAVERELLRFRSSSNRDSRRHRNLHLDFLDFVNVSALNEPIFTWHVFKFYGCRWRVIRDISLFWHGEFSLGEIVKNVCDWSRGFLSCTLICSPPTDLNSPSFYAFAVGKLAVHF